MSAQGPKEPTEPTTDASRPEDTPGNRPAPKTSSRDDDKDSRSVVRGGTINALGSVFAVVNGLFLAFVSRVLGPEVLGSFVLAETYVSLFLRVGLLGMDKGLLRHVPIAQESADPIGELRRVLGTGLRYTLAVSFVIVVGVLLLARYVAGSGGGDTAGDGAFWLSMLILALPGRVLSNLFLSAIRGNSRMAEFVVVQNIMIPALLFGIAAVAVVFGAGSRALIIAYVASAYIGAATSYVLCRRNFGRAARATMVAARTNKQLVSFSVPQGFSDLLNLLLSRVDIIMIGFFFPERPELVAFYAVASLLSGTVKKGRVAFDTSLSPIISRLLAKNDHEGLLRVYQRTSHWIILYYVLFAGVLSLAAPLALSVAGAEFSDFWILVPILVLGRYMNSAGGPAQSALLMSGRSRLEFANNLLINLGNVGLNALLIPAYGIIGAAIATATSLNIFNLLRVVQVRVLMGISPRVASVARVTTAGVVAAIPGALIAALTPFGLGMSAIAGASFVGAFLLLLWALGLLGELRSTWGLLVGSRRQRRSAVSPEV